MTEDLSFWEKRLKREVKYFFVVDGRVCIRFARLNKHFW